MSLHEWRRSPSSGKHVCLPQRGRSPRKKLYHGLARVGTEREQYQRFLDVWVAAVRKVWIANDECALALGKLGSPHRIEAAEAVLHAYDRVSVALDTMLAHATNEAGGKVAVFDAASGLAMCDARGKVTVTGGTQGLAIGRRGASVFQTESEPYSVELFGVVKGMEFTSMTCLEEASNTLEQCPERLRGRLRARLGRDTVVPPWLRDPPVNPPTIYSPSGERKEAEEVASIGDGMQVDNGMEADVEVDVEDEQEGVAVPVSVRAVPLPSPGRGSRGSDKNPLSGAGDRNAALHKRHEP